MKKKFSRRCERDLHLKIVGSEKSWIRPKKISLESNVGPLAIAGALGGLICAIYICTHSPLLEVTNLIGVLVAILALLAVVLWGLRTSHHAEETDERSPPSTG
ncbi:MAG TPA: hypothetical protein PKN33_21100 [Phycisphaerae bacterium]|nr:hypothetical protein [Phycisphaerae bacterium]